MNKNPEISIIVPVYNAENSLIKCLDTLKNQTFPNIEIVLINDGSTDSSLKICLEQATNDSRIKVFSKKNGGVSSARNYGINKAIGEYIIFVDSDDYVALNMCEEMLKNAKRYNTDLVIASYYTVYNNNVREHKCPSIHLESIEELKPIFLEVYLDCFLNSPWNKLYIKKKIKSLFREDMNYFEDYFFNLMYIMECEKITFIDQSFYFYKEDTTASLTKRFDNNIFNNFELIYKKQLEFVHKYFGTEFDVYIASSLIYGLYNSLQKAVYTDKENALNYAMKWRKSSIVINALSTPNLLNFWNQIPDIQLRIAYKLIYKNRLKTLCYLLQIKKILNPIIQLYKKNTRK